MRSDPRAEIAAAVARFLTDIQHLGQAVLERERERILATIEPSRARPAAAATDARQPPTPAPPRTARARAAAAGPTPAPPSASRARAAAAGPTPAPPSASRARAASIGPKLSVAAKRPAAARTQVAAPAAPVTPPRVRTPDADREPLASSMPSIATPAIAVPPLTPPPEPEASTEPAAAESAAATGELGPKNRAPSSPDPEGRGDGRIRGVVSWFHEEKGYGFILAEDGQEAFVHHSAIVVAGGFRMLRQGQAVEYRVEYGRKGPQAVQVTELPIAPRSR